MISYLHLTQKAYLIKQPRKILLSLQSPTKTRYHFLGAQSLQHYLTWSQVKPLLIFFTPTLPMNCPPSPSSSSCSSSQPNLKTHPSRPKNLENFSKIQNIKKCKNTIFSSIRCPQSSSLFCLKLLNLFGAYIIKITAIISTIWIIRPWSMALLVRNW